MKNLIILLVFLTLSCFGTAKLPSSIRRCHRNDPNISECILSSVRNLQPALAKGDFLREVNAPLIEPFFIDQLSYGNDRTLKITIKNIVCKGGSNFIVEKLRVNIKDLKLDFIIKLPRLEITGKYFYTLNLLSVPLKSDGDFYNVVDNSKARISLKGYTINKNGIDYVQFHPIQVKILPGDIKALQLSNLFDGNRVLGEAVQALLVSNKDFLAQDTTPHIEKALSGIFTAIANKILSQESLDELLPL